MGFFILNETSPIYNNKQGVFARIDLKPKGVNLHYIFQKKNRWALNPKFEHINHSNSPNCKLIETKDRNKISYLFVITIKDINKGEQITINYNELPEEIKENINDKLGDPIYNKGEKKILEAGVSNSLRYVKSSKELIEKYKEKYSRLKHVRTSEENEGIMCLDKDKFVGIIQWDINTKYIVALEVIPEYRKKGIGRKLLDIAYKNGIKKLSVNKNNQNAIDLYKSIKFKKADEDNFMYYMVKESGNINEISLSEGFLDSNRKYKCPFCDYRNTKAKLITHIEKEHQDMIPKNYTAARILFNHLNNKEHGSCIVCKRETKWREDLYRYDRLCGRKKCSDIFNEKMGFGMQKKYGTKNLLSNPEHQKKMLKGRHISGKYKFSDNGVLDYVGSFEHSFLEFFDKILGCKSSDLRSPGPVISYEYNGKILNWITDFYYIPFNLIIEIKDGGDNPNTRDMKEYREKQIAKEKALKNLNSYNYIRLTNNNFKQLIETMMKVKEQMQDSSSQSQMIMDINESFNMGGAMPPANRPESNVFIIPCFINNTFVGSTLSTDKYLRTLYRVQDDALFKDNLQYLYNYDYKLYKVVKNNEKVEDIINYKGMITNKKDYFYTAITGKPLLDDDQFEFEECFERVEDPYINMINELRNIYESMMYQANILMESDISLDIINESLIEEKNKRLIGFNNIDIKQDMDGYFLCNTLTNCRSKSYTSINEIPDSQYLNIENMKL